MNGSDKKYLTAVCAIIVVALALRAIWASQVPVVPFSDSEAYHILARTLVDHGVYGWSATRPSAFWPPGTSAVYATLYWLFGSGFVPIVVLNVILSTGIVGLTIWLGRTLFDRMIGIIAGLLMAIWPSEIAYVTILASEIPFTFFVLLGCVAWFNLKLPNSIRAVCSGLAFAAATYFRPIALLLPVVLWLSAISRWKKLRGDLPVMLCGLIVVAVAVAPWSLRNTKVFGHFVPMSTADGANLWMGNNAKSDGFYMPLPAIVRGMSEYDQNKILAEDALLFILEKPGLFVMRSIEKAALLHIRETTAITWNNEGIKQRFGEGTVFPLKAVTQSFWSGCLLLAFVGLALLALSRGVSYAATHPVVLIWAYFTAVYSIVVVADRYHLPSHPFISMLASIAIMAAVAMFNRRSFEDVKSRINVQ